MSQGYRNIGYLQKRHCVELDDFIYVYNFYHRNTNLNLIISPKGLIEDKCKWFVALCDYNKNEKTKFMMQVNVNRKEVCLNGVLTKDDYFKNIYNTKFPFEMQKSKNMIGVKMIHFYYC